MAQSTVTKVDELEKLYRLADADKVNAYLNAHPDVIDLLLEAWPHIEAEFGKDIVVELRFPRDESDFNGELLALVQSDIDAAAFDRIDEFWNQWWGDAYGRPESRPLFIGVEFARELAR